MVVSIGVVVARAAAAPVDSRDPCGAVGDWTFEIDHQWNVDFSVSYSTAKSSMKLNGWLTYAPTTCTIDWAFSCERPPTRFPLRDGEVADFIECANGSDVGSRHIRIDRRRDGTHQETPAEKRAREAKEKAEERAREAQEKAEAEREKQEEARREAEEKREQAQHEKELRDSFKRSSTAKNPPTSPELARDRKACLAGDAAACERLQGKKSADQKQQRDKERAECMARPVSKTVQVVSNLFPTYVHDYQEFLADEQKCEAQGQKWTACWREGKHEYPMMANDQRAQSAYDDMLQRWKDLGYSVPAGAANSGCLERHVIVGTQAACWNRDWSTAGLCRGRLEDNINDLQCAAAFLPSLFEASDAQRTKDAEKRRDEDCLRRYPQ
jgi:hypothetical protein